jgi:hypothetical protein
MSSPKFSAAIPRAFGDRKLIEITRDDLQTFLEEKASSGLSFVDRQFSQELLKVISPASTSRRNSLSPTHASAR